MAISTTQKPAKLVVEGRLDRIVVGPESEELHVRGQPAEVTIRINDKPDLPVVPGELVRVTLEPLGHASEEQDEGVPDVR
jgi:hypothetical protein